MVNKMRKIIVWFLALTVAAVILIPAAVNWFSPAKIEETGTRVRLFRHDTGEIISLAVDDYLIGVVAAEMPAEFPLDALKAQAVAARTYIMKRLSGGGVVNPLHPGADVCDDHRHYQAWISREEMKERWGAVKYYQYYFKMAAAVFQTGNEVLTCEGDLIDPVYHSSCGGAGTISAGEVWKYDVPYLKGVPCPYDADPQPEREAVFSAADLERALGADISAVPASTGEKGFFEVTEKTTGGQPKTVRIGDGLFSAVGVREALGLRSARFNMTMEGEKIKVSTTGYGHGVGMCQYGAKGMALKGKNYKDILKYYYTGVEINTL